MPEASARTGDPVIAVEEVTKRFGREEEPVLDRVSLTVAGRETVSVIGPSGCGKSTLLNLIAGLVKPTSGGLSFGGRDRHVAYVFQRPRLLPWRRVAGNVRYGLEQLRGPAHQGSAGIDRRTREALRTVNLIGHEDKYPHQLSGGMQQRVALARGLAIEPELLLLDEPFGALDALTRGYLQEELLAIVRRTEATTVLVTHDIDEALLLGDRVVAMSARPGRITSIVDVPFGPTRSMDAMITDPRYPELRTHLREQLRPARQEEDAVPANGELVGG